jgi:orotate phosphoribosyltransferase
MKPDWTEIRVKALAIIRQRSFRRGRVKLASGKESEYYLDMKPSMFDPEAVGLLARLVMRKLKDTDVDMVGGLEMGAVPLVATVVMHSRDAGRPLPGFFVRKTVKDHGTQKLVEGGDVAGKNVVVLEDVTTTGESAMTAVRAAQKAGATVTLVLSIVDRQEGATEFFKAQGIPFGHLFTAEEFLKA